MRDFFENLMMNGIVVLGVFVGVMVLDIDWVHYGRCELRIHEYLFQHLTL